MLNTYDKLRSYFDPEYGAKAAQLRHVTNLLNNGSIYDSQVPTANYNIGYDVDEEEEIEDLEGLRNTSRVKDRNNGFVAGITEASTDHVIGTGLVAKSTLNRRYFTKLNYNEQQQKDIEDSIDDYFLNWCFSDSADVTNLNDFFLQQALAYRTWKIDGECFGTLMVDTDKKLKLKLIGAEHIQGGPAEFKEGIKVDVNRRPIAYNVKLRDNNTIIIKNYANKQNMIHLFRRKRIEVLRGVPFLTNIMIDVDVIDDYMRSELKAAKLAATFIGSIKTHAVENIFDKKVTSSTSGDLTGTGKKPINNPGIDPNKRVFKEATITQLQPGEELIIHDQSRDNPNFDKVVDTALKKVSSYTRMPLEIILTIFTSSYSASRASMLLMGVFTRRERKIFNNCFNDIIRDQVIEYGVLKGELILPNFEIHKEQYLKCEWIGDSIGSVDPVKDTKSKVEQIKARLTTYEKATRDLGNGSFEDNMNNLEKEENMLKSKGLLTEIVEVAAPIK
jgi:lambda family phage portal protein